MYRHAYDVPGPWIDNCTMLSDEIDLVTENMAALLGVPCVLEDVDFNVIAYSAQGAVDPVRERSILQRRASAEVRSWFRDLGILRATAPMRTPAQAEMRIEPRLCLPVRHAGRLYGFFWAIDNDERIDPALWGAAMATADEAGDLLGSNGASHARSTSLVRDLLNAEAESSRRAAERLGTATGFDLDTPVTCLVLHGAELTLDRLCDRARPGVISAWITGSQVVVVAPSAQVEGVRTVEELVGRIAYTGRVVESLALNLAIGVGPSVGSLADASTSWGRAKVAAAVARTDHDAALPAGRMLTWADLGPLRLLAELGRRELRETLYDDAVGRFVLEGDRVLVETARVYLDEAGSVGRTAQRLTLHRQSVYHRLGQIERAAGLSLAAGADRLRLHLALAFLPFAE